MIRFKSNITRITDLRVEVSIKFSVKTVRQKGAGFRAVESQRDKLKSRKIQKHQDRYWNFKAQSN
jgi:hypothetical protein